MLFRSDITDEEIERVRQEYDAFINLQTNQEAIAHLYMSFFTSELCTALKAEYAAMNDDQLSAAMNGCPSSLINVAIKIKNDDWANRE